MVQRIVHRDGGTSPCHQPRASSKTPEDDPIAAIPVKTVIAGAYSFCEEQQAALDQGRIAEEQWYRNHERHLRSFSPAVENPRGQSGNSGDEARYWYSQEMILAAITRSGTFLDVGWANSYLMEKIAAWSLELGCALECHGLDISAGLIDLTRRCPLHQAERFFVDNAFFWMPETAYHYVCVKELGYWPQRRRREFFFHLVNDLVEPGGAPDPRPVDGARGRTGGSRGNDSLGFSAQRAMQQTPSGAAGAHQSARLV